MHRLMNDALERYGTALAGTTLVVFFLFAAPNFAQPANLLNIAK